VRGRVRPATPLTSPRDRMRRALIEPLRGRWGGVSLRLASALHLVLERSSLPYGYTLTVWSSGAMLMHRHGLPLPVDVFLFLLGGVLGFGAVTLVARGLRAEPLEIAPRRMHLTGALQALSVVAAVAVADLVAQISGEVAWPVGSFAATATFLLSTAFTAALASA
jgi:hypothetical protein